MPRARWAMSRRVTSTRPESRSAISASGSTATTRPPGRTTLAISAIAAPGSARCISSRLTQAAVERRAGKRQPAGLAHREREAGAPRRAARATPAPCARSRPRRPPARRGAPAIARASSPTPQPTSRHRCPGPSSSRPAAGWCSPGRVDVRSRWRTKPVGVVSPLDRAPSGRRARSPTGEVTEPARAVARDLAPPRRPDDRPRAYGEHAGANDTDTTRAGAAAGSDGWPASAVHRGVRARGPRPPVSPVHRLEGSLVLFTIDSPVSRPVRARARSQRAARTRTRTRWRCKVIRTGPLSFTSLANISHVDIYHLIQQANGQLTVDSTEYNSYNLDGSTISSTWAAGGPQRPQRVQRLHRPDDLLPVQLDQRQPARLRPARALAVLRCPSRAADVLSGTAGAAGGAARGASPWSSWPWPSRSSCSS